MVEILAPVGLLLHLDAETEKAQNVFKALASEPRMRILRLLGGNPCNVSEIAEALSMALSTTIMHINILEEAGLLLTELKPATRGSQKICARAYDTVLIDMPQAMPSPHKTIELSMPVGGYVSCQVAPTCGLTNESGIIGLCDDPASFYEPGRFNAQLLWFHHGYVEYHFPNRLPSRTVLESFHLILEVCSEAPLHNDDWPSDITVWINGIEIGTWMSPADFGGRRGKLTPDWWYDTNTQYGLLKVWQVNQRGSLVDGLKISDVTLSDLNITQRDHISVRIGVKETAEHVGGINIFGRKFGNYPQDIMLRLHHQ